MLTGLHGSRSRAEGTVATMGRVKQEAEKYVVEDSGSELQSVADEPHAQIQSGNRNPLLGQSPSS
jgi:hypothetical protein